MIFEETLKLGLKLCIMLAYVIFSLQVVEAIDNIETPWKKFALGTPILIGMALFTLEILKKI